jgi:uncharacterized membrane protein HdeD (DUF308 family)
LRCDGRLAIRVCDARAVKRPSAGHLPWWGVLALGVACVALGGVLIADPSLSLSSLEWLVAAALVLTGLGELASVGSSTRPALTRVVAWLWIATGVVAAAWPSITIRTFAIVLGVALLLGGTGKVWSALRGEGDERLVVGLSGVTNVVVGVLALSWPGVTVLVLAILLGVRTVVFGFGQVALALRSRDGAAAPLGWPRWLRLTGTVAGLLLALAGAAISAAIDRAAPAAPGAFYRAPSPLPAGPPGTIIRTQVVKGFQPGATAYRVLCNSTGYEGTPTAVSGLIIVPDDAAPAGGRRVLAYTHGTTGVASNCAPSLVTEQVEQPLLAEGGAAFLAAGYVIAASDYQGLGTRGTPPPPRRRHRSQERARHRARRPQPHRGARRQELRRLGTLTRRPVRAVHRPARHRLHPRAAAPRDRRRRPRPEPHRPLQGPRQFDDRQDPRLDGTHLLVKGLPREPRPDPYARGAADRHPDRPQLPLQPEADPRLAARRPRPPFECSEHLSENRGVPGSSPGLAIGNRDYVPVVGHVAPSRTSSALWPGSRGRGGGRPRRRR